MSSLARWHRPASGLLVVIVVLSLVALVPARAQPAAREAPPLALAPDGLSRLVDAAIAGRPAPQVGGDYSYSASRRTPATMLPAGSIAPASSHNDGYTPEQNFWIDSAVRSGLSQPYRPNTAADLAWLQQWQEAESQRTQTAELVALQALQQTDFSGDFGLGVLRAGGDPNVYFAQNPLPNTFNTTFQNPIDPGAGFNALDPIGNTLNAINTSLSRVYPSPFLDNLNNLLYQPASGVDAVPLTPASPPATCSVGNPYRPTRITFFHFGSRPLIVSLKNYLCQEVFFAFLLPQTIYTQLTFVGQTWTFRDIATGELILGEPEYTIPDQGDQTYTIVDVPLAGAARSTLSGGADAAAPAQNPPGPAVPNSYEGLKARYAALAEMQLGNYYGDPEVSRLRAELNQQVLLRLQTDPLYLHWKHEYDTAFERVRSAQPSYARLKQLSDEIASWIAPGDEATQRARNATRQEQLVLQARLDEEVAAFLSANPTLKGRLAELDGWISARVALVYDDPSFVRWHAEWQRRWNIAYLVSDASVETTRTTQKLTEDFPAFARYQQVRRELVDLLPGIEDSAPVRRYAAVQAEVLNDPAADRGVREAYERYLAQTQATLGPTSVPVTLESYYNSLNGLVKADPAYAALEQQDRTVIAELESRQAQISAAVAACFADDSACDPYEDPGVTALLYDARASRLVAAAADHYEAYNRFWHAFYTSQASLDLENRTKAALKAPLAGLQATLDSARQQYERDMASVPQLARLQDASEQMVAELCPAGAALSAGPITDPTAGICSRMAQLESLDRQIGALNQLTAGGERSFLPLVSR